MNEIKDKIEKIEKIGQEIDDLKSKVNEKEITILDKLLNNIAPVTRFIDEDIKIFDNEFYNGNYWQGKTKEYPEKGIILQENIEDYSNERFYWIRKGSLYIYTRSGKIVQFTRSGNYSQYQNSSHEMKYTEEGEIDVRALLEKVDFDTIVSNIKKYFDRAVKNCENKVPILKKRIELLDQIINII